MKKLIALVIAAVAVGMIYGVLMYYDNNFPFGRMRETPAVRPHENPLPIMEAGLVPVHGGEALYRAANPAELTSPHSSRDPKVVEAGAGLYFTFCQQCHGVNHDGNGTVGQSFAPLPTDLRSPKVQPQSEGVLFQHISYGFGGSGRQPALATTIFVDDRWRIVAYVKALGTR
ncbi:MAG: cytochrome c [Desulfobacterales bacterium]